MSGNRAVRFPVFSAVLVLYLCGPWDKSVSAQSILGIHSPNGVFLESDVYVAFDSSPVGGPVISATNNVTAHGLPTLPPIPGHPPDPVARASQTMVPAFTSMFGKDVAELALITKFEFAPPGTPAVVDKLQFSATGMVSAVDAHNPPVPGGPKADAVARGTGSFQFFIDSSPIPGIPGILVGSLVVPGPRAFRNRETRLEVSVFKDGGPSPIVKLYPGDPDGTVALITGHDYEIVLAYEAEAPFGTDPPLSLDYVLVFPPPPLTATIFDAWWCDEVDGDGDGCFEDSADLMWDPDVVGGSGALSVFEKIYSFRPADPFSFLEIAQTAPHTITGTSTSDVQLLRVPMKGTCHIYEYFIEIWRVGESAPDFLLGSTLVTHSDPDLENHKEQQVAAAIDNAFWTNQTDAEPDGCVEGTARLVWDTSVIGTARPIDVYEDVYFALSSAPTTWVHYYRTPEHAIEGSGLTNRRQLDIAMKGACNLFEYRIDIFRVGRATADASVDGTVDPDLAAHREELLPQLPDLIVWSFDGIPGIFSESFGLGDCDVLEGCITVGSHRVMRFDAIARNIGAAPLDLGAPTGDDHFVKSLCYSPANLAYYNDFAEYRLVDVNGQVRTNPSHTPCVFGDSKWDTTEYGAETHTCDFQGIAYGYQNHSGGGARCSYIDATGLPPGAYVLELEANPERLFAESNYCNNIAYVPYFLDGDNNDCGNAMLINDGTYTGSTLAATTDGTASCGGAPGAADVWYSYTAPFTGFLRLNTCCSGYNTVLSVRDACPGSGTELRCDDDGCLCGGTPYYGDCLSVPIVGGKEYKIRVSGFGGETGDFTLHAKASPSTQPNGACTSAIPIGEGVYNGTTVGETADGVSTCGDYFTPDVWYSFNAPCAGTVLIDTCGSDFNTVLSVHTGCPGTLSNELFGGCNDDCAPPGSCCDTTKSCLEIPVRTRDTYFIRVSGYNRDDGNFRLRLRYRPPYNDRCTNAIHISDSSWGLCTLGARTDGPVEVALCTDVSGDAQVESDIWFSYTASCTGTVNANLCGSSYDTKLAVYNGPDCPQELSTAIACNDDSCSRQSEVTFAATAGNHYLFRVGGYRGRQGEATLTVGYPVPCGPSVLTWKSVLTHTRPVVIPIDVPLDIPNTGLFSEPRSGIKKIVVTFDGAINPATAIPANVTICGNDSAGSPVSLSGVVVTTATTTGDTKMEINFTPGLPDFARYRIALKTSILGVSGGAIQAGAGGLSRILTALQGDAFGDLRVNATDIGAVRSLVPTDPINPAVLNQVRSDANNDKRINATDVGGIRSKVPNNASSIPDPVCP